MGSVALFFGFLRAAGQLQRTIIYNCSMRVRVCFAGYPCVRVCVCVAVYVCMLQVFYGTVCWRPSASYRPSLPSSSLRGCSPILNLLLWKALARDRTGCLPSRRSQNPRVRLLMALHMA